MKLFGALVLSVMVCAAVASGIPLPSEEAAGTPSGAWTPDAAAAVVPQPPPLPTSDSDVVDMDADIDIAHGAAAAAEQEFELDAAGKPRKVAAAKPAAPLTRAQKVQTELNEYQPRYERNPKPAAAQTAKPAAAAAATAAAPAVPAGAAARFAEVSVSVDAQAEAESAAQAHADLALAMEAQMEAAAGVTSGVESQLDMEVDAELDLDLAMETGTETSPAAKTNENYACYRWSRPPKAAAKSVAFAPREGHASWLSKNGKSLYTFGGCDRQTLPKNCYGELKQMDVKTRVWRNRKILGVIDGDKDTSLHMQGAAQAADPRTGQRLFVFGGLRVDATDNSAFSNSLDLLYYDKRQKEWSWTHVKTTGDHPPPSQDATLVMVGDQLVLFGGYSDIGFFNDVYTIRTSPKNVLVDEKDPELWKWKKVHVDGTAPPARRGHSMTLQSSGGSYRGFVFGGVSGTAALNDMYVLSVPNHFASPPAPAKGSKAARALAARKSKPVKHWSWMKVVAGSAGRTKAIPPARAFHASLVVRPRHLLVFGGCDPFTQHCYDDVLLFNTRTMTWLPTPPSLLQSAMAPVVRAKSPKSGKAGKSKDGKAAVPAPPQSPKRRFPAWNPSARKKLTVTLLANSTRVMVVGGCDRVQCFGDVYEMELKGVCIDSCGDHGRFVDYRVPAKAKNARRGNKSKNTSAKSGFIELAAEHTLAQAEAAYAEQFEADQSDSEDDSEEESEDETEVIDEEEEAAENRMIEAIELTAEQALESTTSAEDDDTIDHHDAEDAALLQVDADADPAPKPAATTPAAEENMPSRKMKLVRKKEKKSKKSKKSKKAGKFQIGGLLSKLSLDTLKELNKERSFDAKCMCRDGYTGKFCQKKGLCHLNCSGHKNGLCVTQSGSSYCVCSPGWWGQGCQYRKCKNNCSSHGVCVPVAVKKQPKAAAGKKGKGKGKAVAGTAVNSASRNATRSVCKCEAGFWGKDCSLAEEWRRDQLQHQQCTSHCHGMGHCTRNYTMSIPSKKGGVSKPLFHPVNEFNLHPLNRPFDVLSVDAKKIKDPKKRAAIERRQVEARKKRDEQMKSQAYKCACRAGYGGDDCKHQCPLLCSRHGSCNETGQCVCDSGWTGAGCNVPSCGEGNHCTYHGKCDLAANRCKCDGPFRGPACDIDTSCSGHGKWQKGVKGRRGHCKCNPGWFLEDCSLELTCPNNCAKKGRCILKGRKAARQFKPLSRTLTPPKVKGQVDTTPPPLPRKVAGICICEKGFQSLDCSSKVCPKACNRHGECVNGQCRCYPGYTGQDCGTQINCPGNCTSAVHGACTQVRHKKTKVIKPKCKCAAGWAGADCSAIACPKGCSKAGKCMAGQCQCNPGRFGADCSIKCPKGCSGHGECQSTGQCACDAEFTGKDCATRKSCPSKSNAECSGHGVCHIPSSKCHCEPGYSGRDCSKDESSCHSKDCSSHGACSFGKCFCQIGWSGENCEYKTVCKQNCNNRGICNMGKCECNPGWSGDACTVQVWDNTCPGGCNNHGLCSKGVCSCIAGWTGNDCNTVTDFCKGNTCSGRGTCVYNKCQCLPGTTGPNCEHGSTCPAGCDAKHGVCLLGTCHCLPGFSGPTCTDAVVCPGASALGTCSGHGVCLSGSCACEAGWGGVDCSMSLLPAEMQSASCARNCSGAGVCYMGKCFCVSGYGGNDCSITYDVKCPNDCTGHAPRFDQRGICHLGRCLCHPGYSGESCQNELKCPAKCSVNGVCAHGHCFCVAGWTGPACDWPLKGNLKHRTYAEELKEVASRGGCGGCSMHGLCIDNKCVCESGYGGPNCADVAGGVVVHRCPNSCAGQGLCVFGKCFCNPGWTGTGCEKPLELACPNDCQKKGICRFGQCFCYPGFDGADCSQAAKCDAQCGVHGVCLDGRCVCADGFSGEQCNIATRRNPNPNRSHQPTSAGSAPASFIDTHSSVESNELPSAHSLIESDAHTTNSPATTSLAATKNNAAAASSPRAGIDASASAVQVTTYSFPLLPLVVLAFVGGVICSTFAKCMLDKREQMRRQEQLISPLLQVQN